MFDFAQLSPDPDRADGVWTRCLLTQRDGTKIDTGADLLIAYAMDNPAFDRRQAMLTAQAQRAARGQELNQAEQNEIARRAAVGPVLKDWRGFVLDGQDVPYSAQAAEKAMLRSVQFAAFVSNFAADLTNFRTSAGEPAAQPQALNPDAAEEEQDGSTGAVLKKVGDLVGSPS